MSREPQPTDQASLDRLREQPALFGFVRAVELLQRASPGSVPIGREGPASSEALRLRPALDLGFADADVARVTPLPDAAPGGPRHLLETRFMGLYGQASPLPAYFTENLVELDEPNPIREFIDLFHHRMLSLAFRVMTKHRLADGREHAERLGALVGQRAGAGREEDPLPARALLACGGLMSQQPRSASALGTALTFWLEAPVEVEQCVPRWAALPAERQVRLGVANCALGADCIIGERLFERSTSFRIVVGPIPYPELSPLLPGGRASSLLRELVAEFNAEGLDYDVEAILAADQLPPPRLDSTLRLGWDAHIAGQGADHHRIRFSVNAA
jgi:type VI secretion system protein ImpH